MKASIDFKESEGKLHPLYHHYSSQITPQPAFVEIDLRDGTVRADWDAEYTSGVPAYVWHNIGRRYKIPHDLTHSEISKLLEEIKPLAQRMLDGSEVELDNNVNLVGRLTTKDAEDSEHEIERLCAGTRTGGGGIMDAWDFFEGVDPIKEYNIKANMTGEEIVNIVDNVKYEGWKLDITLEGVEDAIAGLLDEVGHNLDTNEVADTKKQPLD